MKKIIVSLLIIIIIFAISLAEESIPKIDTLSAIAIEANSGRILYEKNGFSKRPMASTTKIMTIILAVENGNLDDIVTVSRRAAQVGGSNVKLKVGDKIKLSELLYGLMLSSGNDAGIALAEHIGESVENFAKMMNSKAVEIGAYNTSFTSPHGLDNPEHYSTAYDMAIITRYALKNPIIANIVKTIEYNMYFVDGRSKHLMNTNPLLKTYDGVTGVKTGYTGMAGKCLVSSAKRNGMEVIVVTLGSQSSSIRIKDSINILNYCFNEFQMISLEELYNGDIEVPLLKGKLDSVKGKYKNNFIIPIKKNEIKDVKITKNYAKELYAPINKNEHLGKIVFKLGKEILSEVDIISTQEIKRLNYKNYFVRIILSFCNIEKYFN